jgi:peptide/nickel transport system permease protein
LSDVRETEAVIGSEPRIAPALGGGVLPGRRKRRRRSVDGVVAAVCATILGLVVLVALIGPLLPGIHPYTGTLSGAQLPPVWLPGGSSAHPFGTDQLGRDELSRLVVGAQTTVLIAVVSVLVSLVIGTIIGLVAGYFGGVPGAVLMRITDAMLAIPAVVLGIAFAAALGPGVVNLVIVVIVTTWAFFARVVRGETLRLRDTDFIVAARVSGISRTRILLVHLLPNTVTPIIVMATLQIGNTIILAASLSFLGLGVPNPRPEWGLMLADAKDYLQVRPWLVILPAIALGLTILCCNVLGDWARDHLDPYSKIRT